jgi:hypothetical protein
LGSYFIDGKKDQVKGHQAKQLPPICICHIRWLSERADQLTHHFITSGEASVKIKVKIRLSDNYKLQLRTTIAIPATILAGA